MYPLGKFTTTPWVNLPPFQLLQESEKDSNMQRKGQKLPVNVP